MNKEDALSIDMVICMDILKGEYDNDCLSEILLDTHTQLGQQLSCECWKTRTSYFISKSIDMDKIDDIVKDTLISIPPGLNREQQRRFILDNL